MIGERKAKVLFAGGVALFVTGLVVLMLFVIPAAQHTQVAMAQPAGGEAPPPPPPPPTSESPVMSPDVGVPGGMGAPGAAPAAPVSSRMTSEEPLEASRPNPFAPRATPGAGGQQAAIKATTYGPDWSKLPIAERIAFVAPEIPPAPTPPPAIVARAPEVGIRITSILWDASGQAQAAYEDSSGKTGILKPGDRINGYTVTEITRSGVRVENQRTGEREELELQPRAAARQTGASRRTTTGRQTTTGTSTGRTR